jgi:hypothetical protein
LRLVNFLFAFAAIAKWFPLRLGFAEPPLPPPEGEERELSEPDR